MSAQARVVSADLGCVADLVLGIDLGTSFSSAAAWVQGKLYLVPDRRGEPCIPSIVYFPQRGLPIVGADAERYRNAEPDACVSGIKRILGKKGGDPEISLFQSHSAVSVEAPQGMAPVIRTRNGEHTATEVASHIIRLLKERAEERFQTAVKKAVMTLPATANDGTRAATLQAARMAGIEVLRTVSEPSAAAIAYNLDAFSGQRKLLVYDFGGGTFDSTVLEQSNAGFRSLAVGGDSCLGGDDFDQALAHQIASFVYRSARVDVTKDVVRWDRIVRASEQTKRALSARESAPFRLTDAFSAQRKAHDLNLNLHREDVEPAWDELTGRSLKATARMLHEAGLRPADIDTTVFVGGSTFIPMVRRSVDKLMTKPGVSASNPQTAVACGAAIVASRSSKSAA